MHWPTSSTLWHVIPCAEHGCLHPLRDVVTVPHWPPDASWTFNTANMTLDELVAGKNK